MNNTPTRTFKEKVKTGFRYPQLICRIINRNIRHLFPPWDHHSHGVDFFEQDWDNLIILDACRFDIFDGHHSLPGSLKPVTSNSSSTVDFLFNNFDGRELLDTVYITANGQIANFRDELDINIHSVEPLYATAWNEELGTVPPQPVVEKAIEAQDTYPNKRLVIHFVQPHLPFIPAATDADKNRDADFPFWMRFVMDDIQISSEEVWKAYVDNLNHVLPHVETLLKELEGKSVVTADHGNSFGERARPIPIREWGHPKNVYIDEVVTVPWLESENGSRREIVAEDGPGFPLVSDPAVVQDRLEALGYS